MIGTTLGNYRIVDKIGEGGMGVVYKAVDVSLDRPVAVKALNSEYSHDPELLERFRAEGRAQANLSHPNIATLYTLVVQDGQAWMVMEYVEGESIEQMIGRRGLLPPDVAVPLFKQALLGIGYAHRSGIIHRDIKPTNLMVNRQGIVKVMDFGIAKVSGSHGLTRTGTRMGTLLYMSPEQVMAKPVDIRSDIYSLGVTLYEMLTASVPFGGDSDFQILSAHVNTPAPPPSRFYPYIPAHVEAAVLKALEKSPDARFQTVEEFGAALEGSSAAVSTAASAGATRIEPVRTARPVPVASPPTVTNPILPIPPAPPAVRPAVVRTPRSATLGGLVSTPGKKAVAGCAALAVVLGAWMMTRPGSTPLPVDTSSRRESPPPGTTPPAEEHEIPPPPDDSAPAPAPAASEFKVLGFRSDSARINAGQRTRLSWAVQGATEVMIEPSIGKVDASGSREIALNRTTQFTLLARKADGEVTRSTVTVEVAPPVERPLSVAFQAQPPAIQSGQSTVLRWAAPGASTVLISPGVGRVNAAGAFSVSPSQTTTYTLLARNASGSATTSEITVRVQPAPTVQPPQPARPPYPQREPQALQPHIAFVAMPPAIPQGGAAVLRWVVRNAASINIEPDPGGITQSAVGVVRVTPASTTTYVLTARSQDGTVATASATIQVNAAGAPVTQAPERFQPARAGIAVMHDHAGNFLRRCWGVLIPEGKTLRYVARGANDGRNDSFTVSAADIQEIRANRMPLGDGRRSTSPFAGSTTISRRRAWRSDRLSRSCRLSATRPTQLVSTQDAQVVPKSSCCKPTGPKTQCPSEPRGSRRSGKEQRRRCSAQQPSAVLARQERQSIAHQRDRGCIGVRGLHLERAVACPHQAAGTVILEDAPDHGNKVRVGRLLASQGIKRRHFHVHMAVLCQPAEKTHVGVANRSVRANPRQVVDHHGGLWKTAAHAIDRGERIRTHQGAHGEPLVGAAPPHCRHAGRIEPRPRRIAGCDPKPANSLAGQGLHCRVRLSRGGIDDPDAGEGLRMRPHGVEHVGVVETIEAHLYEHRSRHAARLCVGQKIGGRKPVGNRRLGSGDARVVLPVIGPDVYVCVDDSFHIPPC